MKKTFKIKNIDRYILLAIIAFLIFLFALYIINTLKVQDKNEVKITNSIASYNYFLKENASGQYIRYFNELYNILNDSNYDEKEYVTLISKLFIIDFYTLNNKLSRFDIGGVEFVYDKIVDNFKQKAIDTIYGCVKSSSDNSTTKNLPVVNDVLIKNINNVSFNYDGITDNAAYEVNLDIVYEEDLGYDTNKKLIFIHCNNKLCLVEIK